MAKFYGIFKDWKIRNGTSCRGGKCELVKGDFAITITNKHIFIDTGKIPFFA
jgi:hypothetical protein